MPIILTRHLVVTTLHSSSTTGALKRLLDLGVSLTDLEETLHGIVAQRLVDLMCPYCGEECQIYCRIRRKRRRGAIYELLIEDELKTAMRILGTEGELTVPRLKLNSWLRKGISLGYLPAAEWTRRGKGGYET